MEVNFATILANDRVPDMIYLLVVEVVVLAALDGLLRRYDFVDECVD